MDNLIKRIRQVLERNVANQDTTPLLSKESYKALPFSMDNFHFLEGAKANTEKKENAHTSPSEKTLAFVDGGQAELLSSPDLCVGVIRACCCAYNGKKKVLSFQSEFYLAIIPSPLDGEIGFSAELFPIRGSVFPKTDMLAISSSDASIRSGVRKATPSSLLPVARRFAELELARAAIEKLKIGDMVVLDGALQQSYTNEEQLLAALKETASLSSITIAAVSKTNALLTRSGISLGTILSNKHPKRSWWYAPVAEPKNGAPHLSFAHLHAKAPHVFLVESFEEPTETVFASLLPHASDSVFLGYPYGLIEADRAARISNQDASYLQTRLMEKIGRQHLTSLISQRNSHQILDSIKF